MIPHAIFSRDELIEHLRRGHNWRERDLSGEWLATEFNAKLADGSPLVPTAELFALHREIHEANG